MIKGCIINYHQRGLLISGKVSVGNLWPTLSEGVIIFFGNPPPRWLMVDQAIHEKQKKQPSKKFESLFTSQLGTHIIWRQCGFPFVGCDMSESFKLTSNSKWMSCIMIQDWSQQIWRHCTNHSEIWHPFSVFVSGNLCRRKQLINHQQLLCIKCVLTHSS